MRHHRVMKGRLHLESGQTDEVLHVWIFTDRFYRLSVGQLHSLLDDERAESLAQTDRLFPRKVSLKNWPYFFSACAHGTNCAN